MIFLFVTEGNTYVFIIPFLTFGIGTGLLLTPIVIALITSVPKELAFSATGLGVGFRLLGVCVSFAFINYFQLFASQNHFNRFQDQLNANNPVLQQRLSDYSGVLTQRGISKESASNLSGFLLNNAINRQVEQRVSIDFFGINGLIIFVVILLLLIRPRIGFNKFDFHPVHPI